MPMSTVYTSSAVSDADGDIVRCRWAESAQGECGGVCQAIPAVLDQVGDATHKYKLCPNCCNMHI